uniref:Uncharacterized protein n=1 Tax=Arundo donax TaxID=35708 RepID=A0A0A9A4I4_ARUDO
MFLLFWKPTRSVLQYGLEKQKKYLNPLPPNEMTIIHHDTTELSLSC